MPDLQGYFNQTYTVEFEVPGALDGVTLSPAISATVPAAKDPQLMYRPEVTTPENPDGNLGLIDVDYDVSADGPDKVGTRGNRYVSWIWIEAASPGDPGAALEVVDAVDGTVTVQKTIADLAGETTFFKDTGILVPQGSLLRLSGFTGGAKVRLHIAGLTDRGLIQVQQGICCAEAAALSQAELEALTYDYRETTQNSGNSFVPAGTSATAHALRVRQRSLLSTFFIWGVVPPAALETVAIRLFRFTPTTLQQVSTTFVLTAVNFVASTKIDLSGFLLPVAFDPDDILACSFVQGGPQQLQPLLAGWTFKPVPAAMALVNPASLPMVWPPS